MNIKLYFPRWIFPYNLGDSINVTFIPRVLKQFYKSCKIEVITQGFLIDVFNRDPNVDSVRLPNQNELYIDYKSYAFSNTKKDDIKVIYPEWHPNCFSFWGKNFKYLVEHKTANIITLNYLLQLNLESLLFHKDFDFREDLYLPYEKKTTDSINVAIVPSTKLAGRQTPHPGCDGVGFRFNGDKGLESWKTFISHLKSINPRVVIHEFSEENYNLGDVYHPHYENMDDLVSEVDLMDIGVMSDGGIHHVFNARKKDVVLFQATKINKCEFFMLSNTHFPKHLHLDCRLSCRSYFSETLQIPDMSLSCKLECENLDPKLLAEYTNSIIEKKQI
jgi:hypothetical protein